MIISAIHKFRLFQKNYKIKIATASYINIQLAMDTWQGKVECLKWKWFVRFLELFFFLYKYAYTLMLALLIQNGSWEMVTVWEPTSGIIHILCMCLCIVNDQKSRWQVGRQESNVNYFNQLSFLPIICICFFKPLLHS